MADTTFTNSVTLTDAEWFNDLNDLFYTACGGVAGAGTITKVQFPATQVPSADANALDDYQESSFTATAATGLTTTPTATWTYTKIGNLVVLNIAILTGTSNSTAFTVTGLPADIQPANAKRCAVRIQDNGTAEVWGMLGFRAASGTIDVYPNANGDNWTNVNAKALDACSVCYTLV